MSTSTEGQAVARILKRPIYVVWGSWIASFFKGQWNDTTTFFRDKKPTFLTALPLMVLLTSLLYMRLPTTNYIFDEQEALLANPYVNQVNYAYSDAIYRDFWGLPPNASIGSYRPIPNFLWRGLVEVGERLQAVKDAHPNPTIDNWLVQRFAPDPVPKLTETFRQSWFQHLFNLFFHGVVGATFVSFGWRLTRRKLTAWIAGTVFVTAAILTEAVSGVVGIADVLGGLGALLALGALSMRGHVMPFAVFLSVLFGLFCKESAIVCVPLVPVAALLLSPLLHPKKPARVIRAVLSFAGAALAFVLYVELRKRWFPSPLPAEHGEPLPMDATLRQHVMHDFYVWFHQAPLPKDPLNNPLVDAPPDLRVAGALRVYWRGLVQVVFPLKLSGDYSFPQEPAPPRTWSWDQGVIFPESVLGWLGMVLPLGAAAGLFVLQLYRTWKKSVPIPRDPDAKPRVKVPWNKGFFHVLGWLETAEAQPLINDVVRAVAELAIILGSIFLVRKMLLTGPSHLNDGLGDTEPEKHIDIPTKYLWDTLAYGAVGCAVAGALTELLWKPRKKVEPSVAVPVLAVGFVWLVVSYFPHSNIAVLLPTVRAERLWYFPVIGTTLIVTTALVGIYDRLKKGRFARWAWAPLALFLGFQAVRAYTHATDYRDDLQFWRATKDAVPMSAKAHLNYSVMVGVRRGDQPADMPLRLMESHVARELAPDWPMAHVYTGDTLCRMGRVDESWPYYKEGFQKGPNEKGLISLGLQCLWDNKKIKELEPEIRQLEKDNPGSWIAYLGNDIILNGDKQGGVQRENRPRSYNEAAKDEEGDGSATGDSTDSAIDVTATQSAIDLDDTSSAKVDASDDVALTAKKPLSADSASSAGSAKSSD